MNRELDNHLNNFYKNGYDEEDRLVKDKMHYIEFITTTKYIDKYLKEGDRILEVGAGTGRYSLYYADKGYKVDSLELVQANIDVLKSKVKAEHDINAVQGNALDLSMYPDNTFDVTLVLGPLYHLFKKEEQEKVISEAHRVTKKGGIIYFAFILFDLTMLDSCFVQESIKKDYLEQVHINRDYKPINKEDNLFNLMYFKNVKELLNNYNVIHYVATDGIGKIIKGTINEMDEETYDHYINYHLSICEREDLIGYSGHILGIVKK